MWDYTEEVKKWSSAQVMTMYEKSEEDKLKFKCLDCNEFFKASVHPRSGKFIVSNLKKHLVTEELKGKKFKPPSGFEGPTSDQNLPSAQDVDPVEKRNPAKAALKPKLAMAGTGKRASGEVNNAVPGCSGLGTGVQSQQAVALESASGSDNSSVGRTSQPDKHLEKLKSEVLFQLSTMFVTISGIGKEEETSDKYQNYNNALQNLLKSLSNSEEQFMMHTRFDSRQRLLMEPCGVSTKQAAASVCPLHSVPPGYVAKTAPLEEVSVSSDALPETTEGQEEALKTMHAGANSALPASPRSAEIDDSSVDVGGVVDPTSVNIQPSLELQSTVLPPAVDKRLEEAPVILAETSKGQEEALKTMHAGANSALPAPPRSAEIDDSSVNVGAAVDPTSVNIQPSLELQSTVLPPAVDKRLEEAPVILSETSKGQEEALKTMHAGANSALPASPRSAEIDVSSVDVGAAVDPTSVNIQPSLELQSTVLPPAVDKRLEVSIAAVPAESSKVVEQMLLQMQQQMLEFQQKLLQQQASQPTDMVAISKSANSTVAPAPNPLPAKKTTSSGQLNSKTNPTQKMANNKTMTKKYGSNAAPRSVLSRESLTGSTHINSRPTTTLKSSKQPINKTAPKSN